MIEGEGTMEKNISKTKRVIIIIVVSLVAIALLAVGWHFAYNALNNLRFNPVNIVFDESYFSEFKIEGGKVLFICSITAENMTNRVTAFSISATADQADVDSGLLKEREMVDKDSKAYYLQPNEKKTFEVVFVGENNKGTVKSDKLLPLLIVKSLDTAK